MDIQYTKLTRDKETFRDTFHTDTKKHAQKLSSISLINKWKQDLSEEIGSATTVSTFKNLRNFQN